MSEVVRFSRRVIVPYEPAVVEQIDEAARQNGQKRSEFIRQATRKALQADGLDPIEAGRAS